MESRVTGAVKGLIREQMSHVENCYFDRSFKDLRQEYMIYSMETDTMLVDVRNGSRRFGAFHKLAGKLEHRRL